MTPRLTTPQLTVLRALDAFGGMAPEAYMGAHWLDFYGLIAHGLVSRIQRWPSLTPAGRALVARLKAEGRL